MNRRHERAARPAARVIATGVFALAVAAGCKAPAVGAPVKSAQGVGGPKLELTGAAVQGGHVVVTLRITRSGVPIATAAEVAALNPRFTLAALSVHPVDQLAEWKSFLLNGTAIPSLPLDAPGTSAPALSAQKQPGAEGNGTLTGADGAFQYAYATPLPAACPASPGAPPADRQCLDPAETLRVGAWLLGNGTEDGTSTFDFRPDGGAVSSRELVLDAACRTCHDAIRSPKGAVGVKICATCHTWQNADPDTADPAALDPASPGVNPNPLDLGRLVHRIHRGKNLPTLYAASSTAATPVPALPPPSTPAAPFFPGRNTAILGRKFSIVGPDSREVVFGRVLSRADSGQTATKTVATGVTFPRDLRDCAVCHRGAQQASATIYAVSRRTCAGCHPDVWYAVDAAAITDTVHLAHTGGPQPDDAQCRGCHVAATSQQPRVWAPIAEIHVTPYKSPRFDRPVAEIVAVDGLTKGGTPTIKFKFYDELGAISALNAAAPDTRPYGSPVPRALTGSSAYFAIQLSGPTSPAFGRVQIASVDTGKNNPDPFALVATSTDKDGVFTYAFGSPLPDTVAGTWAVGIEARRRATTVNWDATAKTFRWPYTGEALGETPRNPLVYVDTATGTFRAGVSDAAVARRQVVAPERCERCHERISVHGTVRMRVDYCLLCHAPQKTDYEVRPKVGGVATAPVNLNATYDGIEERSIDFKVLIHRIHTGGREGSASLQAIEPFAIYGKGGGVYFFDEGLFPGDLRDCTLCHLGRTYEIDAVPADAPPTVANETSTIRHQGDGEHVGCTQTPPIQAACKGCHATGFTERHAEEHTVGGVEQCAQCHLRGSTSVDLAHGLATADTPAVSASFSSLVQDVLVPRCASAACHGGSPPPAFPRLDADAAYGAIVNVGSQQASGVKLVEPYEPGASYLLLKMRGEGGTVGGIATPMPISDAMLSPSELAAFEAWILNGAPND